PNPTRPPPSGHHAPQTGTPCPEPRHANAVTGAWDAGAASPGRTPQPPRILMTPNPDRDAWLRRVRALLDKARSTSYAEEADALVAKAHELMERHAIDEALLATTDERTDPVLVDHLVVAAPYPKARAALL